MSDRFIRSRMLLGEVAMERIRASHVAVFGVGGVGGAALEALARCGVGELTIVDNDTVSESNINRQIIALESTVGRLKTDVFCERIKDIDPLAKVHAYPCFFSA